MPPFFIVSVVFYYRFMRLYYYTRFILKSQHFFYKKVIFVKIDRYSFIFIAKTVQKVEMKNYFFLNCIFICKKMPFFAHW
ncbi:MAG: hypothetical protein BHW52_08300 [Ruminococcus sp. 37_24]|nr:MAG: hypothetical protein BHW52_08300 [Ruminococcus sp. 37_24]